MGSCVSVHRDLGLPDRKAYLASTPTMEKAVDGGAPPGDVLVDLRRKVEVEGRPGLGTRSPDAGSKDEMFFESRAWLDSDCEDDFYSVNGDFTPSRGSTPNYQPRTQTVMSNVFVPDNEHDPKSSSEPSPTGRRKLADLLQDATRNGAEESTVADGEPDGSESRQRRWQHAATATLKQVSKPSSVCSTETTPAREARSSKERGWYMGRCCLPTFVHSLSLEDERRQKMSSGHCAV